MYYENPFKMAMLAIITVAAIIHSSTTLSKSKEDWNACTDRIYDKFSRKGVCGTGGCGDGGQDAFIKYCGYMPITNSDCSQAYVIYLEVQEQGPTDSGIDDTFANAELGYLKYFDKRYFDLDRMKKLIRLSTKISRADFGKLLCGE